jgi:glutamate formiminotransferase
MASIISAVPNVCEGRDEVWIGGLQKALEAVPGLVVLDVSMDQVRNRTVFSIAGGKESLFEGGFLIYQQSYDRIDMRRHRGEYPRVGAVDVFPFVAVQNASMETTVAWSVEFAEKVAARFKVPVYLFAESARAMARRDIENIR